MSGLSDGTVYYVVVLDDTRIKLVTTHDEAVNGATQYHFSPGDISSNTISVAGSGFTVGQAVQYHSPTPTGFATGQVDFIPVYNSDGTINVSASNNPGANNIWFLDGDGNNMPSGFSDGDIIVYHVTQNDGITPGTAIGPLVDGGVYRVVTSIFTPYSIQLKNNTAYNGLVDYTRSGAGDQIIRLDGHTWAEDGFGADQDVIVASSAFNNGSYHISSVSGAIMTLVQSNVLTASKVTTSVTFGHTDVLNPDHTLNHVDYWIDRTGSWTANTTFSSGSIIVTGTSSNNVTYTISSFGNNGSGTNSRMFVTSPTTDESGVTATFAQHFSAFVDEPTLALFPIKDPPGALPPAPQNVVATADTIAGGLAQDAYFYRVTAISSSGESIGSSEVSALVHSDAFPLATGQVHLSWDPVTGATSYVIYRGTVAGGENIHFTTGGLSFTDTGVGGVAGGIDPAPTHDPRFDNHTIILRGQDHIGGLQNGITYYVVSASGDDIQLATTPGGTAIALSTSGLSGGADHYFTKVSVDLGSASGTSELRIDLTGSSPYTPDGTGSATQQRLDGPGGVPLGLLNSPPGDGVSSTNSNGSGGGFVGVGDNTATTNVTQNVDAPVSTPISSPPAPT